MFRRFRSWFAIAALAAMGACGGSDHPAGETRTIAEVAEANGLTALGAAAEKAGLATALADEDAQLTVFAPTDAAFQTLAERLGYADANALVAALPAQALADILGYHVLPQARTAAELRAGGATQPTIYEYEGSAATLALDTAEGVAITDAVLTTAEVTKADVDASNGVVHVIDKVLVPPGVLNVVQMAQANPTFSTLVSAVVQADLQGTLGGTGPFTVFAPTNAAFEAIADTVAGLDGDQLETVLTYHVVGARVLAADITFGVPIDTVSGQTIEITDGTPPAIADTTDTPAPIVATDVRASNGVIHVISKVLIPEL